MKNLSLLFICVAALSFTTWQPDFNKARQVAKAENRLILLNFSGSDWCGPCIRMRNEIFENEKFSAMADSLLVLVNADFPRNKKNQLEKKIKEQNETLADQYNPTGKFPFTLLLDANGKIIKSWDGLPDEDAGQFAYEIKRICDDRK